MTREEIAQIIMEAQEPGSPPSWRLVAADAILARVHSMAMRLLPTREEIAEILMAVPKYCTFGADHIHDRECLANDYHVMADAILARLRPAWERPMTQCASCEKSLDNTPDLILSRVNVKGIRGLFVCQWCRVSEPQAPEGIQELPAWPQYLPEGALEAIAIEHERDHSDVVPAEPREGCNGCKMLSHAFALRADLRACAEALDRILPAMATVTQWIKDHVKDLPGLEDDIENMIDSVEQARAALARPGVQAEIKK